MEEKTAQALTAARKAGFDVMEKYFEYLRVQFDEDATLTKKDEERCETMEIVSEYSNLVRNVILLAEALDLFCSVYPTGNGNQMCVYISYYK